MKRHSLPKISSSFTCDTTTSTPLVFTSKTGKPPFVTQFSITLSKVSGKLDVSGCKALHRSSGLVEPNLLAKREFQVCNSCKTLAYLSDRYCYDLNLRAIVNLRDCLECSRIHRDGNVLRLPPKNLRKEGVEAINRGNQRWNERFFTIFCRGVVSAWGESRGQ
jgi:hypothetical protein